MLKKSIKRSVKFSLDEANTGKKKALDELWVEYQKAVNKFLEYLYIIWSADGYKAQSVRLEEEVVKNYESVLSYRYKQCAKRQAEGIFNAWLKRKERTPKDKPPRLEKPAMNLDARFVEIEFESENSFDVWGKIALLEKGEPKLFPIKLYDYAKDNYISKEDWERCKSVRLLNKDGKWYLEMTFEREIEQPIGEAIEELEGLEENAKKTKKMDRPIGKVIEELEEIKGKAKKTEKMDQPLGEVIEELEEIKEKSKKTEKMERPLGKVIEELEEIKGKAKKTKKIERGIGEAIKELGKLKAKAKKREDEEKRIKQVKRYIKQKAKEVELPETKGINNRSMFNRQCSMINGQWIMKGQLPLDLIVNEQCTMKGQLAGFMFNRRSSMDNRQLALDIGYRKLLALSDGKFFGEEIKQTIKKVENKQQNSKAEKRLREQVKNEMGQKVNEFFKYLLRMGYLIIFMEILKNLKKDKGGEWSHKVNRKFSFWTYSLLIKRIKEHAEVAGVQCLQVPSKYTSRTCPVCLYELADNRKGEKFKCLRPGCGYENDADIVGSLNVLRLGRQTIVTYAGKSKKVSCNK